MIRDDDHDVERARADFWLPDVFRRVQATYERYAPKWPELVWTWRNGGDWRSAAPRTPGHVHTPGTSGGDDWKTGLTPECIKRVEDVREWIQRRIHRGRRAATHPRHRG